MKLQLRGPKWLAITLAVANCLPLPGLGAIIAGYLNPHTTLMRRGTAQLALVLLGSYPLILPGLAGLAWAIYDAIQIGQAKLTPWPPKPTRNDEPKQS